jgi:hypothetical protein
MVTSIIMDWDWTEAIGTTCVARKKTKTEGTNFIILDSANETLI